MIRALSKNGAGLQKTLAGFALADVVREKDDTVMSLVPLTRILCCN